MDRRLVATTPRADTTGSRALSSAQCGTDVFFLYFLRLQNRKIVNTILKTKEEAW